MNLNTLTSANLRTLAGLKEQIENIEAQARTIINGTAVNGTAVKIETVLAPEPPDRRKAMWTPARKRKMREARRCARHAFVRSQIARWKRQGRDGRGQLI